MPLSFARARASNHSRRAMCRPSSLPQPQSAAPLPPVDLFCAYVRAKMCASSSLLALAEREHARQCVCWSVRVPMRASG
eukprot:1576154-Pleurochrysis_carterae.AAC.1